MSTPLTNSGANVTNSGFLPPPASSGGGSGTVTSVTAGDTTITVGGTATDPTIVVGTLVPGSNGVPTLAAADASVTVGGTATARTVGLPLSAAVPLAPGTAAAGTSTTKANDDHRHAPLYRTWILASFNNVPANATTGGNMYASDSNLAFVSIPRACQLTAITFTVGANPADTVSVKVRKNGTPDGTINPSLAAGTTRHAEATGSGVTFAAGDQMSFEATTGASWTSTHDLLILFELSFTA